MASSKLNARSSKNSPMVDARSCIYKILTLMSDPRRPASWSLICSQSHTCVHCSPLINRQPCCRLTTLYYILEYWSELSAPGIVAGYYYSNCNGGKFAWLWELLRVKVVYLSWFCLKILHRDLAQFWFAVLWCRTSVIYSTWSYGSYIRIQDCVARNCLGYNIKQCHLSLNAWWF